MFSALRSHAHSNVVAYVALFVALGGTGAYAANTIGSSDVVNESLLSEDFKQDALTRGDLAPSTLTGHYVLDESLSFFDLAPGTIVNSRLADNAVNSAKVASDSVTGGDIDESTLTNARTASKVRLPAPVSSSTAGVEINVPLSGNIWSQALGESQRVVGDITVDTPASCMTGSGTLEVKLDGDVISSNASGAFGGSLPIPVDIPVATPSAAGSRTLTITISDNCDGSENFTVSDVKIDVVGIR